MSQDARGLRVGMLIKDVGQHLCQKNYLNLSWEVLSLETEIHYQESRLKTGTEIWTKEWLVRLKFCSLDFVNFNYSSFLIPNSLEAACTHLELLSWCLSGVRSDVRLLKCCSLSVDRMFLQYWQLKLCLSSLAP